MSKILVIDDDEVNQRLFKAILQKTGHVIFQAFDGADGIQIASNVLPDLILMDIQMPAMDGVKAVRLLQSNPLTMDIPVVALTACAMREDKRRLLSAGFKDYIAKPISVEAFLSVLSSYCYD